MNKKRNNRVFIVIILFAIGIYVYNNFIVQDTETVQTEVNSAVEYLSDIDVNEETHEIDYLTSEKVVVAYLKEYQKLPDYYITKAKARSQGWVASKGNLCEVLPGRAIGGDNFGNREKKLPSKSGRKWFEADLNYNCNQRNADRVVFSNDGLIYVTFDHYNSFQKR